MNVFVVFFKFVYGKFYCRLLLNRCVIGFIWYDIFNIEFILDSEYKEYYKCLDLILKVLNNKM